MDQDTVLKTARLFRKALESNNIQLDQLILYGSQPAWAARDDSDIDIVVISTQFLR